MKGRGKIEPVRVELLGVLEADHDVVGAGAAGDGLGGPERDVAREADVEAAVHLGADRPVEGGEVDVDRAVLAQVLPIR